MAECDKPVVECSQIRSLKELAMLRMDKIEEIEAEHEKAYQMALNLQAKEYERRLDFLNGEAHRLTVMQETYLLRTLYESEHEALCKRVETLENYRSSMEGKASQSSVSIGYAISAVTLIVAIILHFVK
jgi:hypothetical protein